jgi:hypothetical protein
MRKKKLIEKFEDDLNILIEKYSSPENSPQTLNLGEIVGTLEVAKSNWILISKDPRLWKNGF